MAFKHEVNLQSRRAFLRTAGLSAAAALMLGVQGESQADKPPYGPFRMGVQSYTLRHFGLDEALQKTQDLKLGWWEGWDGHMPVTSDATKIQEYKDKLKAHNIKMITYGVVGFSGDEADARKKFDFARAMGIQNISADPAPEAFPVLDKLCDEYKINIGIHNHGPGARYDKFDTVQKAIAGHNERIGACIDTGHYLRSDSSPVAAAAVFGKRIYGVHIKDVILGPNGEKQFTETGKGILDSVSLLKALRNSGYQNRGILALEYEEHEENPVPYVEECLAGMRRAMHTVTEITLIHK